jgi:hypothetical protein
VWDRDIESLLRDLSLKRDPNAPAEVSSEDLEAIQQRADVTHLREVFEAAQSINPNRDRRGGLCICDTTHLSKDCQSLP